MYDDTPLRKKITCISSGLLLCFVISAAAIGISVIVLLKFTNLEKDPTTPVSYEIEISDLRTKVDQLRQELNKQDEQMKARVNVVADSLPELEQPTEDPNTHKEIIFYMEDDGPSHESEAPVDHEGHEGHTGHEGHEGLTGHEGHEGLTGHEGHTGHEHHHGGEGNHLTDLLEETSDDSDESSVSSESGAGNLCDDSDLCLPPDMSGDFLIGSELDGFMIEGSGYTADDDCPQFARPTCPEDATICFKTGKCPVPVCCYN